MRKTRDNLYQSLRAEIKEWIDRKTGKQSRWVNYLLLAPDMFHLLWKLSLDSRVPVEHKTKLAIALAYFVLPIDIVPEALIGPIGYLDDIALAAYVLNGMLNSIDSSLVREHWAGEEDILTATRKVLAVADEMIGKGLWRRIRGMVDQ